MKQLLKLSGISQDKATARLAGLECRGVLTSIPRTIHGDNTLSTISALGRWEKERSEVQGHPRLFSVALINTMT